MIAFAGALRLAAGECDGPDAEVRPRWPMTELSAPGMGSSGVVGDVKNAPSKAPLTRAVRDECYGYRFYHRS